MFNSNALPFQYGYANPYGFATPIVNSLYENTIRTSNTVFSTMSCSECGRRLVFESRGSYVVAFCPEQHISKDIPLRELCTLINNNGINSLVSSYAYVHPTNRNDNEDKDEPDKEELNKGIEPPDGFKIEPSGDE